MSWEEMNLKRTSMPLYTSRMVIWQEYKYILHKK